MTQHCVDDGRNVIVFVHSCGEQLGTNALHCLGVRGRMADDKPGGITHLVYMTAKEYLGGMSMADKMERPELGDLLSVAFPANEDGIARCADPRMRIFGPDYGSEIDTYITSMGIWNVRANQQALQHTCA